MHQPLPTVQNSNSNQAGQIAVVILLVVVVLATLGLSQLSQTSEDLFISSQREESTRVFNAAETGVEEALSDETNFETDEQISVDVPDSDGSSLNVNVTAEEDLETTINQGQTATIDVSGASGTVPINWSSAATGCDAASLMLATYSETGGNTAVRFQFIQPNDCDGDFDLERNNDEFRVVEAGSGSNGYNYRFSISPAADDQLVRITALYNDTDLLVTGANVPQAHTVRSEAETNVTGTEEENTIEQIIEVQRTLPAAPEYMNYALYSNGTIQHN